MRLSATWGILTTLGLVLAACGQVVTTAPGSQSVGAQGHLSGDAGCSGTNDTGGTYIYDGVTTIEYDCINVNETTGQASVKFTLSGTAQKVSFVSYKAPEWNVLPGQVVFDSVTTQTLQPGEYTLRIRIPDCQYQIDFVIGDVIRELGLPGSGDTYTDQERIVTDLWGLKDVECDGGEGCTPGYWKNHTGLGRGNQTNMWPAAFTFYMKYNTVFTVTNTVDSDLTLLEALNTGGGGEKALMRHAVAAVLNAASSGVDYAYSVEEVKGIVQDAYGAGGSIAQGDFETAKNLLATQNEMGCPL